MEHEMPATLTGLENLQFCPRNLRRDPDLRGDRKDAGLGPPPPGGQADRGDHVAPGRCQGKMA